MKKILFLLALAFSLQADKLAVITQPILEMNTSCSPLQDLPVSPGVQKCHRAHQGLFNEIVHVLEEKCENNNEYIKVFYDTICYAIDKDALSTFWTYKNGVILLDDLENSELINALPAAQYGKAPTVVLVYPWNNFSVGTRLRHLPRHDNRTSYAVAWPDYEQNTISFGYVPRKDALLEKRQDAQATRQLFVATINNLIDRVEDAGDNQVIPYVWGGSSFLYTYDRDAFYPDAGVWQREGRKKPYTGYDCSEFVMRMAQMVGIDFPWKTTVAINHGTTSLSEHDLLEEGDLIWVPGHVMIVSDIARNEMIEACGYNSGDGCVQRIKLKDLFVKITTYDDLLKHYFAQKTIVLKSNRGTLIDKEKPFKLLKLLA